MSRSRMRVLVAVCASAIILSACGGGGGGGAAGVLPSTSGGNTLQVVSLSGAVTAVASSSQFLMHAIDGSQVTVALSPSTVISGPQPYVGEAVDVAGTPSGNSSTIQATSVKPSGNGPIGAPAGTIATAGTLASTSGTGFTLSTASGTVAVTVNSSTAYADGKPAAGQYVEVSGTSTASGVTAGLVAVFASAPPAITVTGTIQKQTVYGFQLTPASGPPIPIGLTSSTLLNGNVTVGQIVTVSGTGASSAAVFATSVSGSATPSPSPSATPTSAPAVQGTPTPAPVVSPTATATPSATPAPTNAPTATPAPTAAPTATPVPTPVPTLAPTPTPTATPTPSAPMTISMTHVQTGTYLWSSTEGATDPTIYAPYLTWAYPLWSKMLATYQAGIHTIFYVNPVMPQTNSYELGQLNTTYSSVRATDCNGNIITTYNGTGELADPRAASSAAYYSNVVNYFIQNKVGAYTTVHDWDAIFIDNNGPLYGASANPCNYDPSTWGQAFDTAIATVPQNFITNSLATSDSTEQTYVNRLNAPNIIGGEFEECFNDTQWSAEEDSQIETIAFAKSHGKAPGPDWWCYLDNTNADSTTVIPQRLFAYASFLLTYDPNYSLWQESYTTSPSTFQVFPESGFVPLNPSIVPTNISGLKSTTGAYVQSYSACYYRGSLVGKCQIVVNPSSSTTVSVPNPGGLAHSMVISGAGVLDGGSVSFNGSAPSSLAPKTAVVLVP